MSHEQENTDVASLIVSLERALTSQGFTRELLCETTAGPVTAWKRPGPDGAPTVYLSSGMHGDEPAGPRALLELLHRESLAPYHWLICPLLNPTGHALGTRDHAMGIDMNRDYVQRLTPEVAHHAAWIQRQEVPDLFLSLHEDWEATGFYFYEINSREDQPQRAKKLLDSVVKVLPIDPHPVIDDHLVREQGWIYHEAESDFPEYWPEAIFLAKRGCPLSFTFETPSRVFSLEQRIAAHLAAIDAALETLGS